ncbi:UNVERIFIED_CONTAM: hypothetical protein NCL1_10708 [Trichonephila clavipes]
MLLFINRRWLWSMFYFQLTNLALFSDTTKTRLLFICQMDGGGNKSLIEYHFAICSNLKLREKKNNIYF